MAEPTSMLAMASTPADATLAQNALSGAAGRGMTVKGKPALDRNNCAMAASSRPGSGESPLRTSATMPGGLAADPAATSGGAMVSTRPGEIVGDVNGGVDTSTGAG